MGSSPTPSAKVCFFKIHSVDLPLGAHMCAFIVKRENCSMASEDQQNHSPANAGDEIKKDEKTSPSSGLEERDIPLYIRNSHPVALRFKSGMSR